LPVGSVSLPSGWRHNTPPLHRLVQLNSFFFRRDTQFFVRDAYTRFISAQRCGMLLRQNREFYQTAVYYFVYGVQGQPALGKR
jgi:hypothetical protein